MSEPTMNEQLDLAHYIDIVFRRRWIVAATASIVFVAMLLVTLTIRPVYQGSAMIVIEKERGGVVQNGALIENSNEDYYQTQYKLLQSRSLLECVYVDLGLATTADFAPPRGLERLQKAVSIAPVLRSRLVHVRAESHDPKLAAAIANRLSETFVEQNLGNQLFISKEVLQALQLREGNASHAALPAVVNNPLIQTLKGEYAKLESSRAELSQRYTERHPTLAQVRSNMAALDAQIRAETDRIVASLKTELSGQLKGNNVRVVDPSVVPDKPIRPRRRQNLALGLLGGLALGLAFALLIEMLDQSVRTQEDVETKLRQPFLGMIPQTVVKSGRIFEPLTAKELSLTSEAFRNLRTMVDFAGVGGKARALLVTSTMQGEGKSYIATNLAVALAQIGESVLLVDGDLRRPNLHRCFELSAKMGLSDYLASSQKAEETAQLIQDSGVPGLSVLPCGTRPPNPSELLNTPRLGVLIAWARERYDRIVVDCTPMFPINDTLLWGRHIPSAIFVVRYGATRIPLIMTACRKLQTGGIHFLGAAVNATKAGDLAYASYGYYHQQYYHSYRQEISQPS